MPFWLRSNICAEQSKSSALAHTRCENWTHRPIWNRSTNDAKHTEDQLKIGWKSNDFWFYENSHARKLVIESSSNEFRGLFSAFYLKNDWDFCKITAKTHFVPLEQFAVMPCSSTVIGASEYRRLPSPKLQSLVDIETTYTWFISSANVPSNRVAKPNIIEVIRIKFSTAESFLLIDRFL